MSKVSIRKGGITFYPNNVFEVRGWKIPEGELMKLAGEINLTKLVKEALAYEYVQRVNKKQASQ
jgi:phage pi2 protein 07